MLECSFCCGFRSAPLTDWTGLELDVRRRILGEASVNHRQLDDHEGKTFS